MAHDCRYSPTLDELSDYEGEFHPPTRRSSKDFHISSQMSPTSKESTSECSRDLKLFQIPPTKRSGEFKREKRRDKVFGIKKRKFYESKYVNTQGIKRAKTKCTTYRIQPLTHNSFSNNVSVAQSKIKPSFRVASKALQVKVSQENEMIGVQTAYEVEGNLVIDSSILQNILDQFAICKYCQQGKLKLLDKGSKAGCASYLILRCNKCYNHVNFWKKFHNRRLPIAKILFPNEIPWYTLQFSVGD